MKTFIVFILTLAVWCYPLKTASAYVDNKEENPVFINYEQIHKEREQKQSTPTKKVKQTTKTESPAYNGRTYTKEEVIELINNYSNIYGIKADTPLCIARMESGYNQFSKNRSSSASGVFQYLSSTWRATDEGKAGLSVFDADANVRAGIKYMASRGNASPWVVAPRCPKVSRLK